MLRTQDRLCELGEFSVQILSGKKTYSFAIAALLLALILLNTGYVLADDQTLPPQYISLVYLSSPLPSSVLPTYSLSIKFSPTHSTIAQGQTAATTAYYNNTGSTAFVVTGCTLTVKFKGRTESVSCSETTTTFNAHTVHNQGWRLSSSPSTPTGTYVLTLRLTGTVNGIPMQSKPGTWTITVES